MKSTFDVLLALGEGRKIRHNDWPIGGWIVATDNGVFDDQGNEYIESYLQPQHWSEFKEPKRIKFYRRKWLLMNNGDAVALKSNWIWYQTIEEFDEKHKGWILSPEIEETEIVI